MTNEQPMRASFEPEYAQYLGYNDARTGDVGRRDFKRAGTDARTRAYWRGVAMGEATNATSGLDMRCLVHWDNPGFDTPQCGCRSTHVAFAYGHVIPVCERHARVQRANAQWSIAPLSWL